MYVLVKTNEPKRGQYVATPGLESSYTPDIMLALRFATVEAADKERCSGNERIVKIETNVQTR